MMQLTCWISGFFCLFFDVILIYNVVVYYKMMFSSRPWDAYTWNVVRQDANTCLKETGVRDETLMEQEQMMSMEQQQDMMEYNRDTAYHEPGLKEREEMEKEKKVQLGEENEEV